MGTSEIVDVVRGVSLERLSRSEALPGDLRERVAEMMRAGVSTADVATMLDASGYRLVLVPVGSGSEIEDSRDDLEDRDDYEKDGEMDSEMESDEDEDEDEEDRGGLLGLLDRLRTVFGKAVSFEAENAEIARNRKRASARAPHDFRAAIWATRKGVVRCRICGGPAPAEGLLCAGIAKDAHGDYGSEMGLDDMGEHEHEHLGELTIRSAALAESLDLIVDALGCWSPRDAHYMDRSPFLDEGLACLNCVAYCPEVGGCYWVDGPIDPEGVCRLWIIPEAARVSAPIEKMIVERDGQFCVLSEDGETSLGCYDSRPAAEARLRQAEQFSKAAMKTEGGDAYPAEAFAYVPDPERPSTWKLRLWDSPEERETIAQVSRAVSAISPTGFRGERVDIPAADLPAVKGRLRAAWRRVNGPERDLPRILKAETFSPPDGVREEAQRAERWIADGQAGGGFTAVGRRRASDLAAGRAVSIETIRRMASYLARHEVDKEGEGWRPGEPGYPSPGRVAWAAWGGDPAISWTRSILDSLDKGSPGVSEVHVDRPLGSGGSSPRRRPAAPMIGKAEPGSVSVGSWVSWDSSGGRARGRIERLQTSGRLRVPDSSFSLDASEDDPAALIRLWREGPEGWRPTEQRVGHRVSTLRTIEPLTRSAGIPGIFSKADERRFTLGPWYVPGAYDAHGEWTDADELQTALWGYVRKGDRQIRLQHNVDVVAGEWVEALTWPYPVSVPMMNAESGQIVEQEFPADTVFMGVVWEPWAWDLVKQGKIRGYSMGGAGERITVDLPSEGSV